MNKTKLASLLLSALLGVSALSACVANPPANTAEENNVSALDAVEEFTPEDVKYDSEFNMLISGKAGGSNLDFADFDSLENTATSLESAVYQKIAATEDLYGVDIVVFEDMGAKNQAFQKLNADYLAGASSYDAAVIAAYDAVPLAINSCLYELSSLPGLDLSKSWWDQRANRDLSVHGCIFYTTGDITFWDDMQQNVIAFNKQVKENLNIEDDFYQLVSDGKWTLEALAGYAKLATEDLNADGSYDMSDQFGMITWDDSIYAVFGGSGEKVVTADANGKMALTLTGTERIVNVLSTYTDMCFNGDAINYQRYTANEAIAMFSENRALFFLGRLQSLDNFRDMDTDYGILPYPKFDAAQETYYTAASPYHMTFVCVPSLVSEPEMSGNILEALGYYGQKLTTPEYYEKTLTGKYFRDGESMQTLELMAATRAYDIGLYIQPGDINKELIYLFRKGSKNFASTFDAYKSAAENALTEVDAAYQAAAKEWK